MSWVYLLRSTRFPEKTYIGRTMNLEARLKDHAEGRSRHTSKFGPWNLVVAIQFRDPTKAAAFELYLKSGSGHAFARRHFWEARSAWSDPDKPAR